MTFMIQSILIAVLCAISGIATPLNHWGWYTLGRPLVGGALCGLILGDVQTGIELGIAVQLVYLALVTPGGVIGTDISFVAYPTLAIAILGKLDAGTTIALAATIGVLGTLTVQFSLTVASFYTSYAEKPLEEGNYKKFRFRYWVWPYLIKTVPRFIPAFLAVYFGGQYVNQFMELIPEVILNALTVLGGVLPAVGIAVLLLGSMQKKPFIIFFLIGYVGIVFLNLNIIALTIIAAGIAYMYFIIGDTKKEEVKNYSMDEEEVL